jgi:TrmH family RNA methyltransferase
VASGQSATLALYDPDVLAGSGAGTELLRALPSWADRSYEVSAQAMARASQTATSSGVLAVIRRPSPAPFSPCGSVFGVVLDRLNDPGNAGAIVRTADALGADYVATLPGSVDLFSPKVVRAGMGPISACRSIPSYPGTTLCERAGVPPWQLPGMNRSMDSSGHSPRCW